MLAPLPQISEDVEILSGKVDAHLKEMGVCMVIIVQNIKQKLGYKQTEVGIIPEDWNVKKLGLVADVNQASWFSSW